MIKIISDSTCDLSGELISRYQIAVLPLHILLDDEEYADGQSVTPEQIFEWSDRNQKTPRTSAPALSDTISFFETYLNEGMEIIAFSISESMSASNNVMHMAAAQLDATDRITVIDSANLSTGLGHLVIEAAVMAGEGLSRQEIAERIEALKPKVCASFIVDTLTFLHRGGRCSGVAALAGSVLQLHPRICVEDGSMHPGKKYRGSIEKAAIEYVKEMEEDLRRAKKDRVFITHTQRDPAVVDSVKKYLESLGHFDEVIDTRAGCVISSHCGPGTIGVLYITGD